MLGYAGFEWRRRQTSRKADLPSGVKEEQVLPSTTQPFSEHLAYVRSAGAPYHSPCATPSIRIMCAGSSMTAETGVLMAHTMPSKNQPSNISPQPRKLTKPAPEAASPVSSI